jgi:hypothetical protein
MATRQQAEEAIAKHLGERAGPKPFLIDAKDGRWLAMLPGAPLGVDKEGEVKPAAEVFTEEEYRRLEVAMWI